MGYNVTDILNKGIGIANKRKEIYEDIGAKKCDIPSLKVISKVLVKEEDKDIRYIEMLKKEVGKEEFEEIDVAVYDKMSFLMNEFNKKIYVPEINNVREFLSFSLELEKDTYSLLVDLQGRFVKKTTDIYTKTYKILSDIINNKAEHISTLERLLKR